MPEVDPEGVADSEDHQAAKPEYEAIAFDHSCVRGRSAAGAAINWVNQTAGGKARELALHVTGKRGNKLEGGAQQYLQVMFVSVRE
jgi:hypothetical protein